MFIVDIVVAVLGGGMVMTRDGHIVKSDALVGDNLIISQEKSSHKNTRLTEQPIVRDE